MLHALSLHLTHGSRRSRAAAMHKQLSVSFWEKHSNVIDSGVGTVVISRPTCASFGLSLSTGSTSGRGCQGQSRKSKARGSPCAEGQRDRSTNPDPHDAASATLHTKLIYQFHELFNGLGCGCSTSKGRLTAGDHGARSFPCGSEFEAWNRRSEPERG